MATLKAIREGLQKRLETIPGLHAEAQVPDSILAPMAWVQPEEDNDLTFATSHTMRLSIIVVVQGTTYKTGQDNLDEYLIPSGTKSIQAAIEGDLDLNSTVDTIIWHGWRQ